ncbi:glucokinase-like ROK family protein [Allocatelliglobosispora scoriae]|uniref:Glucokinase-like ROK family protein n=1 Tax=Allocatelliglobosispora scoriae TaxID=643052 RepID=A0A841BLS4_9ACTN|nr:ROK family transcriptional regulator [Allocatelliglobosispora scoriae]MBB5867702.1 glucokinase-like ROK family protein [Allocatelliglobosispora scoriae]
MPTEDKGPSPQRAEPISYQLLCLLRDHGPLSRVELADRLGQPRSRLAIELDALAEAGMIQGAGPAESRGGRRSLLLRLNPEIRYAAVDLGTTSIDVEITDGSLEPIAAHSEAADISVGPNVVLTRVNEILQKMRADGAYRRLDALGVGLPGPVSVRDGMPVFPPIMPGWDRFPLRSTLGIEHGCPVAVDNDVNIMSIGERHSGIAHTIDNFLFVKVGTGIGCGIHLGGLVHRGADGCAGDMGHIQVDGRGPVCYCGNVGCLEVFFSGSSLAREALAAARSGASPALARRLAAQGTLTARDVGDAAAEGDMTCVNLVRVGGRYLGEVLAGMVSFINPSMIVIGGGLAGLGHLLLADIRAVVYKRSLPLATGNLLVVLSELGPRAGVTGAAVLASELAHRRRF